MKCVKLLLSKGANWKVKDNKGRYASCSRESATLGGGTVNSK